MKHFSLILFLVSAFALAQDQAVQNRIEAFNSCQTIECQLSEAIRFSEFYIETDHMDKSQEWLNYAKKLNQLEPKDSISYFINSMQSEAFYYMELYQFGLHEAEKGIEKARMLKDSAFMADAYFFKGINEIEMGEVGQAQRSLWLAQRLHPRKMKKHLRTLIAPAYIYNNLAQVKLRQKALDSAIIYNRKAYGLAREHHIWRGIVNGEQTFGLIYAEQRQTDSARFYLSESTASAEKFELYDVAALNCAYLMQSYTNDPARVQELYRKGLRFIARHEVNNSYERYFYSIALDVFRKLGNQTEILALQQKIIDVNADTSHRANFYTQHIIEDYMRNENQLLVSRINQLDQERNIAILQLVAALSGFLVLLFVALFFRRKNKLQQSLLEQKNEISKDLHDDIGSELSSILINANLLMKNYGTTEKQQMLLAKITETSAEISQRLNAFIWSLNNENNSIRNFCEYVKRYAGNLLEDTAIRLDYSDNIASVEDKILNGYVRKNLFFCIKEAINNAVRHASATAIGVSVVAKEKELRIIVHDNGIGMGTGNAFGNGFRNIRKRTEALKGTVRFENQSGLRVTITIPLSNH